MRARGRCLADIRSEPLFKCQFAQPAVSALLDGHIQTFGRNGQSLPTTGNSIGGRRLR